MYIVHIGDQLNEFSQTKHRCNQDPDQETEHDQHTRSPQTVPL